MHCMSIVLNVPSIIYNGLTPVSSYLMKQSLKISPGGQGLIPGPMSSPFLGLCTCPFPHVPLIDCCISCVHFNRSLLSSNTLAKFCT